MTADSVSDSVVHRHEAAHCAALLLIGGCKIEYVRVGAEGDPNVVGQVKAKFERDPAIADLVPALAGYWVDGSHDAWPPRWPIDPDELDGVGWLVGCLGVAEEQ